MVIAVPRLSNGTGTSETGRLVLFDPTSDSFSTTSLNGDLTQVECLLVDDSTLYLFGHSTRTNLLQVGKAPDPR